MKVMKYLLLPFDCGVLAYKYRYESTPAPSWLSKPCLSEMDHGVVYLQHILYKAAARDQWMGDQPPYSFGEEASNH